MKFRFLLAFVITVFSLCSYGQTKSLYFVNGTSQKFSICENSPGFDFTNYLTAYDTSTGVFLSYTPLSETQNGSFANLPHTYKNSSHVFTPTTTTYVPPANFSGTDVFTIQVSDGVHTATTTFTVTINPLPTVSAIYGNTISCGSGINSLTNATSNGIWSSDNTVVCKVDSLTGDVTPGAAGTANIGYTVTSTITGCSNTVTTPFVVSGPPTNIANIGLATGSSASICVGSTTTFTDATAAPTGGFAYWKSSNTARATIDSLTGVITGVSAGNSTISYIVTNVYGCSANKTRNVTVTAAPAVDTISYTTKKVCVGSSITLSNAAAFSRTATVTWTTSNANATTAVTGFFPYTASVTGVSAGTDSIYFNYTNGGCTATAALLITVNPLPQVGAITGPTSICQYNTAQLSDTTPKGVWTSNRTAITTINSSTGLLTALTPGRAQITYSVTNSFGCVGTATVIDTVNASAVVYPITGTNSICIGSSTQLADNTIGGVWSVSDSKVATIDNTGLLTGKATGNDTVSYTYTTAGGCTQVVTFPITVASSVVVAPISGVSSICLNNTTQLTDASVDPSATWSSSDPTIAVVDNLGNITTIQAGVVTISYTIGTGSCSGTALKNFIVYGLPGIGNNSVAAGDTSICTGSTFKLTNDSTGGVWSSSASFASVDTAGVVSGLSSGSTVITYSITDKNGCYSSASTTVTVNPSPATFKIAGSNSTCLSGVNGLSISVPNVTTAWQVSNKSIATLSNYGNAQSTTLIANKTTTGQTTVYCTVKLGQCSRTDSLTVTVNKALVMAPIVGADNLCLGSTSTFTDSTNSGTVTWSITGGTGSASISGGVVTPVTVGTATINYAINAGVGCSGTVSKTVMINALPVVAAITGSSTTCAGSTYTYTNATTGNGGVGLWTSSNTASATIDSSTGVLNAIAASRNSIIIRYKYTSAVGCSATSAGFPITVQAGFGLQPNNTTIASLCAGSSFTFGNRTSGGTWSSSNTNVATVNSTTGAVTAVASGSTIIQYQLGGGGFCAAVANSPLTVVPVPVAVATTGDSVLCVGQNTQLYNASPVPTNGTAVWSSSDPTVVKVNATGLVTAVGAGTASIYYTLTNPKVSASTCTSIATKNFTVNYNPVVPSIVGNGSTICVGNTLALSDTTSGGIWGVNDTTIATISSTTGLVTAVKGGNVIFTYTVENGKTGCNTTVFGNGTIIDLPVIGAIQGNNITCVGQQSQLSNVTTQGVWGSSVPSVATVSSTGLVSPLSEGTTIISYTYTNPTYGCVNSATDTLSVNPVPVVGPVTGNSTICNGSLLSVADSSVTGSWSSSNTNIATIDSAGTVTPIAPGKDTIAYTVTFPVTNCSTKQILPITVNATPVASFTVNNTSQCLSGNYFTFTNTSTLSAGSFTSVWTIDGKTFITTNPSYSFTAAGTYTIKLVVSSGTGCADSSTQTVTVNPQSNVGFTINNNSQCLTGNNFVFNNTSTISSGSASYSWSFGDNSKTVSTLNPTYTYASSGTFNVVLTSTSSFGCSDSISQSVTLIANVSPAVSVKASSTSICTGSSVTFTASATNGGATPAFEWFKNGISVGTGTSYSDNAINNGDSIYSVITTNATCYTSLTAKSNKVVIAVAPYVLPSVTISTPSTTICSGSTVTFTASATNGGSAPTYQWTVNGVNVGTGATYTSSAFADKDIVATTLNSTASCVLARNVNSNTVTLSVKTSTSSTTNYSICAGTSYTFNGITHDSAGTYVSHLTNSVGCDSTATLILAIKSATSSTTKASVCNGDSYSFNGNNYKIAGSYTIHLINANGCDSAAILILTVNQPSSSKTSISACSSYSWNGTTYTKGGTYTYSTKNAVGCDSTATLILTITQPSASTTSITACSSYTWNSSTYTKGGSYTYVTKNAVGCDSTATLILSINQPSTSTTSITSCSSYNWNGTIYTKSGSYIYSTKNAVGCDSTATLILTITQPSTSTSSITACSSYTWNGTTYTKGGTYTYSTKNAVGCDSTATLKLIITQPTTSSTSIIACSSYTWNGITYTKSGTYTYTTTNAVGCDSTATLVLTINQPSISSTSITACSSYTWNGKTYIKSGSYTYITKNALGCDSTATLLLTVNYPSTSTTSIAACSSYSWNGTTYTKSGTYTYLTKNAVGCDSTATLLLTVNYPSTSVTKASICIGTSYAFNGKSYDSAGTYVAHLTNSFGCDSAATLIVTLKYPSTSITLASICAGTTYTFNGKSYDSAGSYVAHLTNSVGCDSSATLVLTVNPLTASTTKISICPSALPYTWNGLTFTGAGTKIVHLTNSNGCDSSATLVLSIKQPSSSTTKLSICSSALPYSWNGLSFTGASSLTAHLTNADGCDSAATLILTVNPITTSTTTLSICPSSLPYSWNGITFTAAGSKSAHLTNSNGCDSVATLVLSLLPTSTSTTSASICIGSSYSFNGKNYDSTGTYIAHLTNSVGCDSSATLVLTVKASTTSNTIASVCAGNGYNFNGTIYDSTGSYTVHLTNAVGCDSVAKLVLTVKYPTTSITSASIDSGKTYTFNGIVYSSAGTYVAHLTNSVGCDSVAKLILTVINPTSSTTSASICAGSSYLYGEKLYDSAGTYIYHFTNAAGGDSTATLILTLNNATSSITSASTCAGTGYIFNGTSYDSAGTYITHLTNSLGCDSVATLVLSVKYSTSSITKASICIGSSYTFNGSSYSAAGTYNTHFTSASNCDSVATLILSINDTVSSITKATICAGSSYTFNGSSYDSAGIYASHLTSSTGCDSVARLVLSINYPSVSTTTASICSGSSYNFNGLVYDSAGTYTIHLTNSVGCDSVATLILKLNKTSQTITNVSICSGSSYTFNGVTYDSTGAYTSHFVNSVGCDSAVTLNLKVNYPSTSSTTVAICSGSTYYFNGSVYDTAGAYVTHLTSSTGCDSIATLILKVNAAVSSSTTATICSGSSYTFNGTTYDSAGTYVAHLLSATNCDSVATLLLTVNKSSSSITNATIKKGDSITFNGVVYDSTGTYTAHLTNSVGCDSTATLSLVVTDIVPVTLKSFTGNYQNGATSLSWSSANELNLASYIIQRSSNGFDFVNVKSINATNKSNGATYTCSDAVNITGNIYYRLKLVDKSGVSSYSATVIVSVSSNYTFSVYPNPVRNILTVHVNDVKSENVTIQIVNLLGKQVHQQQANFIAGNNDVTIDVSKFAQGSYILLIKGDKIQQKQFIKL